MRNKDKHDMSFLIRSNTNTNKILEKTNSIIIYYYQRTPKVIKEGLQRALNLRMTNMLLFGMK